jgi:hypothetical protein
MPLSLRQLQDVCLINANDSRTCKYAARDEKDHSLWFCLKKSSKKAEVDDEVEDELKNLKKKGLDPKRQRMPLGDNCAGYPILRHIKQGYDQK